MTGIVQQPTTSVRMKSRVMMTVNTDEEILLEKAITVITESTIIVSTTTTSITTREISETEIEDHHTGDTNVVGYQLHLELYFIGQ